MCTHRRLVFAGCTHTLWRQKVRACGLSSSVESRSPTPEGSQHLRELHLSSTQKPAPTTITSGLTFVQKLEAARTMAPAFDNTQNHIGGDVFFAAVAAPTTSILGNKTCEKLYSHAIQTYRVEGKCHECRKRDAKEARLVQIIKTRLEAARETLEKSMDSDSMEREQVFRSEKTLEAWSDALSDAIESPALASAAVEVYGRSSLPAVELASPSSFRTTLSSTANGLRPFLLASPIASVVSSAGPQTPCEKHETRPLAMSDERVRCPPEWRQAGKPSSPICR